MNPEMQKAVDNFFLALDDFSYEFGEGAVLSTLELVLPNFDYDEGFLEQASLQENFKTTLLERAPISNKNREKILKALGLTTLGATGGTALALGGLAGEWASSKIDQDISIADITTDKALNVTDKAVQDTNDALQTMIQTLIQTQRQISDKLDALDVSVDDSIAAETGESPDQVQARQSAYMTRPTTGDEKFATSAEGSKKGKSKSRGGRGARTTN